MAAHQPQVFECEPGRKTVRLSLTPNQSTDSGRVGPPDLMAESLHSGSGENWPLRKRICKIQLNAATGAVSHRRALSTRPGILPLLFISIFSCLSAETAHS